MMLSVLCMCVLEICVFFLIWGFGFVILSPEVSLYIMDINSLSDI